MTDCHKTLTEIQWHQYVIVYQVTWPKLAFTLSLMLKHVFIHNVLEYSLKNLAEFYVEMVHRHFALTLLERTCDYNFPGGLQYTMGLIYEMNVWQKSGRTVVSTQNLEFINMDVSSGYDQISRLVSARVRKFFLTWTCAQHINLVENCIMTAFRLFSWPKIEAH